MTQPDTFLLRIRPPHAHVRAVGQLDVAISPRLEDQLSAAVAAGCTHFSLDMGDVTFCDASTIAVIINLDRMLRASKGSLDVRDASDHVRYVFRLFGLGRLITGEAPPT
jgi:anti-anti-sigma factor